MPYTILSDVHTHTLASMHAYSTIGENVAAAKAAGLELLGTTDHLSCMVHVEPHIRNYQHLLNLICWPRVWDGVTLVRGAEVDITTIDGGMFGQDIPSRETIVGNSYRSEGTLFDRLIEQTDYLIASIHNREFTLEATPAEATRMYIRAMEHPRVLILGHVGRSGVHLDAEQLVNAARDLHKLVEINDHSLEDKGRAHDSCRRIAELCAEEGVGIAVSTDAHIAPRIGRFDNAEALLEEVHFPQELIMNRDRDTFLEAMAVAGVCDLRDLKGGREDGGENA